MILLNDNFRAEKLEKTDLSKLIGWAADEKTLIQWCGPVFNFPLTIEQLEKYFENTTGNEPSRIIFKSLNNENVMTGMCELGAVDRKFKTASICRVFVDPKFRGQGIADKLLCHVINYAFNELHLRRLELNVYSYNSAAIKSYERLGFIREGMKRKVTQYKDEFWDGYMYGLLKDEWKG